ncbi:hypothetical protein EGJ64_26240 [Pseudomonas aeruginosa]|nr:hypothetical protein EGJ64_26240 [Pseudomonas aeruginosa]RRX17610.1 hypothetical protein EGJ84_24225 [Pseudomonas aeruginosa]
MGQHAKTQAFHIGGLTLAGSDKAVFDALYLSQVLIGQPMTFAALWKLHQRLFASGQEALLHDDALAQ